MPHDFGQRQFALAPALIAPHRAAASTSLVNLSERFSQMIIRAATSLACSFLERGRADAGSCLAWTAIPYTTQDNTPPGVCVFSRVARLLL